MKLSKGKFYKPESTEFGALQPDQNQVLKDLLEYDGKPIGYPTGYSIFNQLGLFSQVGFAVQIERNEPRPPLQRGVYFIRFVRQKNRPGFSKV